MSCQGLDYESGTSFKAGRIPNGTLLDKALDMFLIFFDSSYCSTGSGPPYPPFFKYQGGLPIQFDDVMRDDEVQGYVNYGPKYSLPRFLTA